MGFFSRNKDEYDDEAVEQQTVIQAAPAAQTPQSVDGVLPPGITPQPAPASHNLSSQASSLATGDVAGEYIVTDPPVPAGTSADNTALDPAPLPVDTPAPTGDPMAFVADPVAPAAPDEPAPASDEQSITVTTSTDSNDADDASQEASLPGESAPELPAEPEQDAEKEAEEPAAESEEQTAESSPSEESGEEKEEDKPADSPDHDTLEGLADIKRQALTDLSPLVSHLDQSPEEKFHTIMMLLQSTDDQSLVKSAYEAAQAIGDEKARAQALLDIVHEINYFSQKNS